MSAMSPLAPGAVVPHLFAVLIWSAFAVALTATLWCAAEAAVRRNPRLVQIAALAAFVPLLLWLHAVGASVSWQGPAAVALAGATLIAVARAVHRHRIQASAGGLPPADLAALQKAVETMQIGVTITNLEGSIIYSNPADARLHGYEPEELVGQAAAFFAPGHGGRRTSKPDLERFASWEREAINVRKDGSTFTALLLSDVVRDERGEAVAIVTTCEQPGT